MLAQLQNPDIIDTSQQGNNMNKLKEFFDLALCVTCIALPFVLYFAFVMKPWTTMNFTLQWLQLNFVLLRLL